MAASAPFRQHLIDPEICIRCNTCEATCPVGAVTHDARNYVVDATKCNFCMDCIPPCPTGAIDNWRMVPREAAYPTAAQLGWDSLPAELAGVVAEALAPGAPVWAPALETSALATDGEPTIGRRYGSTIPPWSAAQAQTNLYGPKGSAASITATVAGNHRVTDAGTEYDTHHILLDFGSTPFPVLEGQSLGILPPGLDENGRAHHARQYSVASPRNGERAGYNNVSLAVKRVLNDREGRPVRGVASNYVCDLAVGDRVQVVGPFGMSFLMPNHPRSHLVMICTGTGSAPMRAMTEWRRRLRAAGGFESGKMLLFFGARTQQELPYFGPLQKLPTDFIDINLAFSRTPERPKKYVQDLIRERAKDVSALLADPESYFYVCGLKAMEEGVILALQDVAEQHGLPWESIASRLKSEGRLHLETY